MVKREEIKVEQLVAGLILKFGKIDEYDLALVVQMINKDCADEAYVKLSDVSEDYYVMSDGAMVLNKNYIKKVYQSINTNLLERMQGNFVKRFLSSLDMNDFVLRKIKMMGHGCVVLDDLASNFSASQIGVMVNLYVEDFIVDYLHKDVLYGDYKAIELTQKGKVKCFLSEYKKEVSEFALEMEYFKYNSKLIPEFLMSQNLSKNFFDVLSIIDFLSYCSWKRISPYIEGMDPYTKKRVPDTN